ncbi:uncharacterized protein LOC112461974 [Temnothorax curvispinosus]|uniref:Uncharacterized protein LOC112461974 n=1 Tax=Temnothorax curvispinosus TaxID=300111 RepID=A0A6J1QQG6_9HYME|nr:uncharacterized protein LOC112461974 [Temnothorax curvispinosus]
MDRNSTMLRMKRIVRTMNCYQQIQFSNNHNILLDIVRHLNVEDQVSMPTGEVVTTPLPTEGDSGSKEDSKSKESQESGSKEGSDSGESSGEIVTTPLPTEGDSGSKEDSKSKESQESGSKEGSDSGEGSGEVVTTPVLPTEDFPVSTELPTSSTIPTEIDCPIGNLTADQIVLVCPTGFRRHPKYCNVFYQCTTVNKVGVKVVVFTCPDGTIFDETKKQCVNENSVYQTRLPGYSDCINFISYAQAISKSILKAPTRKLCPRTGRFPYNKGCSNAYYECHRDAHGALQGYLFKCPNGGTFSSVSRRCERTECNSICNVSCKQRNNTSIDMNIQHAPSKGVYVTHQEMFYVGLTSPPSYSQEDKDHLKE